MSSVSKRQYIQSLRESEIDAGCAEPLYASFLSYAEPHREDAHYYRNCQTLAWLLAHSTMLRDKRSKILECGGLSLMAQFLQSEGFDVRASSSDLRYEIDCENQACDLVFSLETIEHIKDQTEKDFSDIVLFYESGVKQYCAEMRRITRAGGEVFVTTPNPCSLRALQNLIDFEPPMVFRPHVREYTRDELVTFMRPFHLAHYETQYSFFNLGQHGPDTSQKLFGSLGVSAADRGDDHLLLFRNG